MLIKSIPLKDRLGIISAKNANHFVMKQTISRDPEMLYQHLAIFLKKISIFCFLLSVAFHEPQSFGSI
jgi:hypothetical protein